MPSAARLAAASSMAVLAFVVSSQIIPLFPEGKDFGYFTLVNMTLGILVGWKVMGGRAGRGVTAAINNGLTGVALLLFWGLFVQGAYEMFRLAMRHRYDGPFESLMAIFEIGFEYASMILVPHVVMTLVIGGILCGLIADFAWRRWS
jgi:hypothetical protein